MKNVSQVDGQPTIGTPSVRDIENGFTLGREALGSDYACAVTRADALNRHLDAWRSGKSAVKSLDLTPRFGTVDWWIERFTQMEAYTRLSARSREDYRKALDRIADLKTELTDARTGENGRVGDLSVSSLSPGAVDKLYAMLRRDGAVRQANYPLDVARRAWKIVARQYPAQFLIPNPGNPREQIALNPFVGVERVYGCGTTAPATRNEAYALAEALFADGHPGLAVRHL